MHIDISTKKMKLTAALKKQVSVRLDAALGRFEAGILHVKVHLEDMNGPKGGIDKGCRLEIKPDSNTHNKPIVIEDKDEDMYAAIDKACDRAKNVVSKTIKKMREKKRVSKETRSRERASEE